MRLDAALQGNLEQFMEDELALAKEAITLGRWRAAEGMQLALRAETRPELGSRVANAWRMRMFPSSGSSLSAAALIETNAEKIIEAFSEGTPIKSGSGFFLAVPSPEVRKLKYRDKPVTPANWPDHRFGPLRFVFRRGKSSLLVVDNQRETKGKRRTTKYALSKSKRALKTGHGLSTVVMFFLVPQVRLGKRINPNAIIQDWVGREVRLIDQAFEELGSSPALPAHAKQGTAQVTTRHEAIVQALETALAAHAASVAREPDKALVVPDSGLITMTLGDPEETGFQLGTGTREWERVIVLGHVVEADSATARNAAVDAALSQTAVILNGSTLGGLVDFLLLGPPLEPENIAFKGADSLRGTLVQVTLFYETSDNPMETQT